MIISKKNKNVSQGQDGGLTAIKTSSLTADPKILLPLKLLHHGGRN
jgi:hypothetical protein